MSHFEWITLFIKLVFPFPVSFTFVFYLNYLTFPYYGSAWHALTGGILLFAPLTMFLLVPVLAIPLAVPFLIYRHRKKDVSLTFATIYGVGAGLVFSAVAETLNYFEAPEAFTLLTLVGHTLAYVVSFTIGTWTFHLLLSIDIVLVRLMKLFRTGP